MRRAKGLLALLLLAAWLPACAPFLAPKGPGPSQPRLYELPDGTLHLVTADSYALPMRAWLPDAEPRAVILALHGFNDHSTFIDEAAESWAAQGIATYAYDQRGFGTAPNRRRWAGTAAYAGDAQTALRLLTQRHPGLPLYLLGESMGGAVAIVALADPEAPPVAGAILAAPAVWSRDTMPFYQRWGLLFASYSLPWFPLTASGLDIQASDNIEALRELGRDPLVIKHTRVDAVHGLTDLMDDAMAAAPRLTVPLLLLYGEKDELVPESPILRLWNRLPAEARARQRFALYRDGWHLLFRDLSAETVTADVAFWVHDPAAPLPSGADALRPDGKEEEKAGAD